MIKPLRILLVSNGFWVGSGYGTQIHQLATRLRRDGHQVALFANAGLGGARMEVDGFRIYPSGLDPVGNDMIHGHADHWQADLVIILYDAFAFNPMVLRQMGQQVCFWQPVDCEPMGSPDQDVFRTSGAQPIAMSHFGFQMMRDVGLDPMYAPHGIDTEGLFLPPELLLDAPGTRAGARAWLREQEDVPADAFVIGMNTANKDAERKAAWEQMSAFAIFHHRHPDAILMFHTLPHPIMSGNNLLGMAEFLGISNCVRWANPYSLLDGDYTQEDMVKWYGRLDLYTGASKGEGFGLPLLEAQACGVPVVTTEASAMPEMAGPGWIVGGQPHWQAGHSSTWMTPDIGELVAAYEDAYNGGARARSADARKFARQYDADKVYVKYWTPIMDGLTEALDESRKPDADEYDEADPRGWEEL